MRKVILDLAISLDCKIEGPNGEYDWCFTDQDYGFTDLMNRIEAVFFGRKSFDLFGNSIPENAGEMEKQFFDMMNTKKKYVFSTTLKKADGAILISKDAEKEVQLIKQQPGKDIFLFGGASLVTTFINANLIDEYILAVHPIILGQGRPLFIDIAERKKLKLAGCKTYSSGLVIATYTPAQ